MTNKEIAQLIKDLNSWTQPDMPRQFSDKAYEAVTELEESDDR